MFFCRKGPEPRLRAPDRRAPARSVQSARSRNPDDSSVICTVRASQTFFLFFREAGMTLDQFVEQQYLPYTRTHKRSWKTDERHLNTHILPHLGSRLLSDISSASLRDWTNNLARAGLSLSSCYRMFWLMKSVLNRAVHWRCLPDDSAFRDAVFPRKARALPRLLSPEEAIMLIHLLERYALRPSAQAIHLLLLTGAAKAEILGARWDDLDMASGTLATRNTFTGRVRLIPLNSEALRLIASLPRRQGVPWLFASPSGRQLTSLFYTWDILRRRIGRPELRLQDLRHSFANFLMNMGVHTHELKNIMGHYMPETMAALRNLSLEKRGQA